MLGRIARALAHAGEADLDTTHEAELSALRAERDELRRKNEDLVEVIYKFEKQRDEWKARFMEQWHQHQNAQAMLEAHIQTVGTTLVRTVSVLNEERAKAGKEAISVIGMRKMAIEGERVLRTSTDYRNAMEALETTSPTRDRSGSIVAFEGGPREPDLVAAEEVAKIQ